MGKREAYLKMGRRPKRATNTAKKILRIIIAIVLMIPMAVT